MNLLRRTSSTSGSSPTAAAASKITVDGVDGVAGGLPAGDVGVRGAVNDAVSAPKLGVPAPIAEGLGTPAAGVAGEAGIAPRCRPTNVDSPSNNSAFVAFSCLLLTLSRALSRCFAVSSKVLLDRELIAQKRLKIFAMLGVIGFWQVPSIGESRLEPV